MRVKRVIVVVAALAAPALVTLVEAATEAPSLLSLSARPVSRDVAVTAARTLRRNLTTDETSGGLPRLAMSHRTVPSHSAADIPHRPTQVEPEPPRPSRSTNELPDRARPTNERRPAVGRRSPTGLTGTDRASRPEPPPQAVRPRPLSPAARPAPAAPAPPLTRMLLEDATRVINKTPRRQIGRLPDGAPRAKAVPGAKKTRRRLFAKPKRPHGPTGRRAKPPWPHGKKPPAGTKPPTKKFKPPKRPKGQPAPRYSGPR